MSDSLRMDKVSDIEAKQLVTPEKDILKILRKAKRPVDVEEIRGELEFIGWSLTRREFEKYVGDLRYEGYDIKKIAKAYTLVRYGRDKMDDYYRILGEIETPFIYSTDEHVGSWGWSPIIEEMRRRDTIEYSVKHIVRCGDVMQGRGVHPEELEDTKLLKATDQMNECAAIMMDYPTGTVFHDILGNHERKMKTHFEKGLDMMEGVYKRVANSKIDHKYYGSVATLSLNGGYRMLLMHGRGGAYTIGYMAQTIDRNLRERPDVLANGHLHQIYTITRAGTDYWMGGTFQRENAWLMSKGITAQPGYVIVEGYDEHGWKGVHRTVTTW